MQIGNITYRKSGEVCCAECDLLLASPGENWKDLVRSRRGNAAERLNGGEFGPLYRVHENPHVELAELFCPSCHGLLSVELYLKGEPYRWDYRSLDEAREQGYDAVAAYKQDPGAWISF